MRFVKNFVIKQLNKRGLIALPEAKLSKLVTQIKFQQEALRSITEFRSQLGQDIFALLETGAKKNGYFIEFGATNGVDLSNTFILEKNYGWHGILAEPARCWHDQLFKNRSAIIDTRCLWSTSGEKIEFNETPTPEFSTIHQFNNSDNHLEYRANGEKYLVETVSLNDLLDEHKAPLIIDYLSIDTEGSEFDILRNFDFDKYKISAITCEHNFTTARENIRSLLADNGYINKFEEISDFDDWYVRKT
jgi:FkbM family methyltransferase